MLRVRLRDGRGQAGVGGVVKMLRDAHEAARLD